MHQRVCVCVCEQVLNAGDALITGCPDAGVARVSVCVRSHTNNS